MKGEIRLFPSTSDCAQLVEPSGMQHGVVKVLNEKKKNKIAYLKKKSTFKNVKLFIFKEDK